MKTPVQVGDIKASSGERTSGFLRVGDLADGCTPVQIPVVILNGADNGPVVYLHAGSHGEETIYSIEVMRRLAREELSTRSLRGAIIIVPVANLLAHQAATRIAPQYGAREGVAFAGDLHKSWPGDPNGSVTQRIANMIWTKIILQSEFVIDFHTNSLPGIACMFMYTGGSKDERGSDVWHRSLAMARAFGLTIQLTDPNPITLEGACMDVGKSAIMVDMPSPRACEQRAVDAAVQGTKNVLAHLGAIDSEVLPQSGFLVLPGMYKRIPSIRANRGGAVRYEVDPGQLLDAGTVAARIFDVLGNELEALRMPHTGYVATFPPLQWNGSQAVATGDPVVDCFVRVD
jgi:predicted deacylase